MYIWKSASVYIRKLGVKTLSLVTGFVTQGYPVTLLAYISVHDPQKTNPKTWVKWIMCSVLYNIILGLWYVRCIATGTPRGLMQGADIAS